MTSVALTHTHANTLTVEITSTARVICMAHMHVARVCECILYLSNSVTTAKFIVPSGC